MLYGRGSSGRHELTARTIRLWLVGVFVVAIGVAVGIRLAGGSLENSEAFPQASGTALYASGMYAVVLFVAPRLRAWLAATIAIAICWAIEFAQLTSVPAALSERSLLLRLVFGHSFDWVDVAWYPVGVVPLALVDALLGRRRRRDS